MRVGLHLLGGLGAAAGAAARHGLTAGAVALGLAPGLGLAAANLAGSALIAGYASWAARAQLRGSESATAALVATGFCGGFTSLSAVATAKLAGFAAAPWAAGALLALQGAGWLAAAALGWGLGRRLA